MARGATEELNALDATFLELEEADHSAHMHIGAVMLFEPPPPSGGPPELRTLRAELVRRMDELPRFRQRLSAPTTGGLHWPSWVEDERFDIGWHVRSAGLPAPGGEAELLDWAGDFFSQRLDRSRPLWEIVLLELADGRWALASKTHHCMVDGVGSVDIVQTLLDVEADSGQEAAEAPPGPKPPRLETGGARPSPIRVLSAPPRAAAAVGRRVASFGIGAARAGIDLASAGIDAVTHPEHAREIVRRSRAMADLLLRDELVAAPATSLNQPIGATRRLAVVSVSLADLKAIRRGLGGTVNDVVLASAAGGLRDLFLERDEQPPEAGVRAMVPVNIRQAAEQLSLGNKITSLFVHLPVAEENLGRRYELQLEEAERLKASDQGIGSRQLIDLAAHAPPVLHTFLAQALFATRLFNVTITNVPGPQVPLYAFGGRLQAVWPLVPLAAEHALGIAVFSYDGTMFFCLNAARDSVPDLELVADGIRDSIERLKELAAGADTVGEPNG